MTYHILYFGLLGDRRGLSEESITSVATTAADLYAELDAKHGLALDTSAVRAAVNDVYVSWSHPLADGDTIAFLPPMSGG